jgi:5-methyltetrahydrofolate--homocysteine methyltransferase
LKEESRYLKRAYNILVNEAGFPPQDIIIDPNVLTVATGIEEHNNYAVDFFETVRWIKQRLSPMLKQAAESAMCLSLSAEIIL